MTAWKVVCVVAIIASGFGTGYLWNEWNRPATPQAAAPVAKVEPQPDADPLLILPPPDRKGVLLDPAGLMVKDHFRDIAGLKSPIPLPDELRLPVPTKEPILPVEHQVRPSPEEATKPVLRVRLNFSFDLDWPTSPAPRPLRPLNQVWWDTPERMPMPRVYQEEREGCTGVIEFEVDEKPAEVLPMPREISSSDFLGLRLI